MRISARDLRQGMEIGEWITGSNGVTWKTDAVLGTPFRTVSRFDVAFRDSSKQGRIMVWPETGHAEIRGTHSEMTKVVLT